MRISIIGSGNVATHLAAAFTNAGHRIVEIWSRSPENAAILAYHVRATTVDKLSGLNPDVDVVLIAVKDDAIQDVISDLKLKDTLLAHTSGSTDLQVLMGSSENIGVFYPLQTFSKSKSVEFANIPILIEGNSPVVAERLTELADSVSAHVLQINSHKRLSLHVSAVFASNFANYLFALSKELLDRQELDFNLIRPLIAETADKVQRNDPKEVQTGPAVRNDQETIQKHIEFLQDKPELEHIYRLLSQSIINFYGKP